MMGKPMQLPSHYTSVRDKTLGTNSYEFKAKGVSISASIFSILIYISVFYIFNLSPSLVFNSTKFWFLLCNTLIIIIAADYGSFSSSSDRADDPYDEYVAKTRQPIYVIYHQPHYINTPSPLDLKNTYYDEDEDDIVVEKNMIFSAPADPKEEDANTELGVVDHTWTVPTQDSIWESISKKEAYDKKVQKENAYRTNVINRADRKKVKKFRRTVSEVLPAAQPAVIDERKNVIHRWESERYEPLEADNEINDEQEREGEKVGEFASMSDDELNRRVEEFIEQFNRHIRLERSINF